MLLIATMLSVAKVLTFDFKDPKEISAVSLKLDSPLEPIVGYAKGISGSVSFDPEKPMTASGTISVDAESVVFSNEGYTATARGFALNAKKFPKLTLKIVKIVKVTRVSSTVFKGDVLADFTCRGITRKKRLSLSATYLPGRAEERTNGKFKGDLLVVRTQFDVSRKEHGISDGIPDEMVGDTVQVGVSVVGIHYAEKAPDALYGLEIEDRDNPCYVTLKVHDKEVVMSDGQHSTDGVDVKFDAEKASFKVAGNSTFGAGTWDLGFSGGKVSGVWRGPDGTREVHGRSLSASSLSVMPPTTSKMGELDYSDLMRTHHVPGMALARLAGGKVIENRYYGVKSGQTSVPVDATTLFQTGTMGSVVLDFAILRLVDLGLLSLEKPIHAFLPRQTVVAKSATVRDLLQGTSGASGYKFAGYRPDVKPESVASLVCSPRFRNPSNVGEPTNSALNSAVLEVVLEKTTHKPAPAAIRDLIFTPLRLRHSVYLANPKGRAAGHYDNGVEVLDGFHVYSPVTDSGLWTTAEDFGSFLVEACRAIAGRPNRLLSDPSLLSRIGTDLSIAGFMKDGKDRLYRGGAPYGFFCQFWVEPSTGSGLVLLQNRNLSWKFANVVRAAILGRRQTL